MTDVAIRRARLSDAAPLAACIDAAYAQYRATIPDLPAVSEGCAEEIAEHLVWVAELEGAVVAGLVLVPSDGFMKLANVAVDPNRRGAGLGRRLLALAEEESLRRGFHEMRLHTHARMPENVRLYYRLGWKVESETGNTVSMRKELSRSES